MPDIWTSRTYKARDCMSLAQCICRYCDCDPIVRLLIVLASVIKPRYRRRDQQRADFGVRGPPGTYRARSPPSLNRS